MNIKAARRTGLVFFPAFDWAISPTHPEREERLLYTQDQVVEEGVFDIPGIQEFKPDLATLEDIRRVHFCVPDETTITTQSHLISTGGATAIARAVMKKRIDRGFALVRPPGHHAMRVSHGGRGFCHINVEAIMAEFIRQHFGIRRIAIIDTDCHHGDGTNDIYWHDPDTLFISIHQDGRTLYPGSGFPSELGGPNAKGSNLNIPLPPGTATEGYLSVLENVILPVIEEFQPEIVINSAGQDNHYTDPLTNMKFCAQGYAELTRRLNPDIAVLEGGYAIEGALPYVNLGIILALAGIDFSTVVEPDYDPVRLRQEAHVTRAIDKTVGIIQERWKNRIELREKAGRPGEIQERHREIYYDTDNIFERQKERIRICRDCGGSFEIESRTSIHAPVFAVHIPKFACQACVAWGRERFEKVRADAFSQRFLQDRTTDTYTIL